MISILLPSRNRPKNIARFIDSFYQNSRGDIEFLFYIDDDDKLSIPELEYQKNEYERLVNIRWIVGKRIPISDTYNFLFEIAKGNIFCITGDDVTCETPGWDLIVNETFDKYSDKLVLVGGRDLFNENLFTTFFLHQEWVNTVGYLTPLNYFDYCDTEIFDCFARVNRTHKIDAIFRHWHPSAGLAEIDSTMREKNIRCYGGEIASHCLFDSRRSEREKIANKLKEKIDGFNNIRQINRL